MTIIFQSITTSRYHVGKILLRNLVACGLDIVVSNCLYKSDTRVGNSLIVCLF